MYKALQIDPHTMHLIMDIKVTAIDFGIQTAFLAICVGLIFAGFRLIYR